MRLDTISKQLAAPLSTVYDRSAEGTFLQL